MTNTLSKKRWTVIVIFIAIAAYTVFHDYKAIRRDFQGKAIEDSFIAAYPPVKLYRDYLARIIKTNSGVTTNHFYPLHELDEDEKIVSVNSVALINLDSGPMTITFPDLTPFQKATVTFLEWDGLALGGESASNTHYTLLPPDSASSDTDTKQLTARGRSVLAFLRIPTSASPPPQKLQYYLDQIRVTGASNSPGVTASLSIIEECEDLELGNVFIPCMDALVDAIHIPPEQKEAFYTAKNKIHTLTMMHDPLWRDSVTEAQQMIDQTLTNGISLVTTHMWIAYDDLFTLKPSMVQLLLNRAAFVRADFVAAPSNKMKYAIKRYNARGEAVEGGLHDYALRFDPALLPEEVSEWHFIVRDHRQKFYAKPNTRSVINHNDSLRYEADGSVRLFFTTQLPPGVAESNWLPIPESPFQIVLIARGMKANPAFDPFEYLEELEILR